MNEVIYTMIGFGLIVGCIYGCNKLMSWNVERLDRKKWKWFAEIDIVADIEILSAIHEEYRISLANVREQEETIERLMRERNCLYDTKDIDKRLEIERLVYEGVKENSEDLLKDFRKYRIAATTLMDYQSRSYSHWTIEMWQRMQR